MRKIRNYYYSARYILSNYLIRLGRKVALAVDPVEPMDVVALMDTEDKIATLIVQNKGAYDLDVFVQTAAVDRDEAISGFSQQKTLHAGQTTTIMFPLMQRSNEFRPSGVPGHPDTVSVLSPVRYRLYVAADDSNDSNSDYLSYSTKDQRVVATGPVCKPNIRRV